MSKITISVCKVYKNSGLGRTHRKTTKRHWKHYFFDTREGKFQTEWVGSIKAQYLKTQKRKVLDFVCPECGCVFQGLVKNSGDACDCPKCED